jgi:transposase
MEDARRMEEAWRRSGEKVGTFARRHGVGAERLRWWLRRLQKEAEGSSQARPVRFAPVRLVEKSAAQPPREKQGPARAAGALEVLVAGGRVVRVGSDFDAALLRRVVAALEEAAC